MRVLVLVVLLLDMLVLVAPLNVLMAEPAIPVYGVYGYGILLYLLRLTLFFFFSGSTQSSGTVRKWDQMTQGTRTRIRDGDCDQ